MPTHLAPQTRIAFMVVLTRKVRPSRGEVYRPGNVALHVLQINVEIRTSVKRKILQQIIVKNSINMVLVQEEHKMENHRLKLYSFYSADFTCSSYHDIATFTFTIEIANG